MQAWLWSHETASDGPCLSFQNGGRDFAVKQKPVDCKESVILPPSCTYNSWTAPYICKLYFQEMRFKILPPYYAFKAEGRGAAFLKSMLFLA